VTGLPRYAPFALGARASAQGPPVQAHRSESCTGKKVTTTRNRLANATSPYLRSAAHQPIDWFEWGTEAFDRARAEDKPILLDIGAVWCHWCHVIDRESYENEEIAAIVNAHFVAVKVDRDERPDIDARYQAAISALSGQGGWPLTAFLTPDGKPFFGGTYFPPDDRFGRPGMKRILLSVAEAYKHKRSELERTASALAEAVAQAEVFAGARGTFDPRIVDDMVDSAVRMFDLRNGGFGRAPKFPHPTALDLVMEHFQVTREPHLLTVVDTSLEKMARGGVYDHLAGGFHRYSVDERWIVPHFEKMSYDNSELLRCYLHGFQLTGKPFYREIAEGIIGWVNAVLSDQHRGGFYASQDADYSLEDDGDYFTWTVEELRAAVTPEEARVAELHFDVEARGEMHHNPAKNVLFLARSPEEIATLLGKAESEVRILLASARRKMLEARLRRPTPFVDTTLYVGWNALCVSAFLEAARVLNRKDCAAFALKTLDRILTEGWRDKQGFAHRLGGPDSAGLLDDQVFTAAALLDAFEMTLEPRYYNAAEQTMALVLEKFGDAENGGFFDRAKDASPLPGLDVRRKPLQDSPTPAASAHAVTALLRLHALGGRSIYYDFARQTLEAFANVAGQFGLFAASYGLAASLFSRHPIQTVITGERGDPLADKLEAAAHGVFRFGKTVLRVTPEHLASGALPGALRETLPGLDAVRPQALVCSGTSCLPLINDPENLANALATAGRTSGT
jgi:uncharacterized protein YyaL (SSP411 family)